MHFELPKSESSVEKVGNQEFLSWLSGQKDRYLELFDYSDEDIKDKKILEVGAGDRRFAASLMLDELNAEVYSLEPALSDEGDGDFANKASLNEVMESVPMHIKQSVENKTVTTLAEKTGFDNESFDHVIAKSLPVSSAEVLASQMKELLRVGKEVRFYPVTESNREIYDSAIKLVNKTVPVDVHEHTTAHFEIPTENGDMKSIDENVVIIKHLYADAKNNQEVENFASDDTQEAIAYIPFTQNRPMPKVVGSSSDAEKQAIGHTIVEAFGEKHFEKIDTEKLKEIVGNELEKTPAQLKSIEIANDITDRIMKKAGVEPFDIPDRNIHIVPAEIATNVLTGEDTLGSTFSRDQAIVINAEATSHPLRSATNLFHEMIHLKQHLEFEAEGDETYIHRQGAEITSLLKKEEREGGWTIQFQGLVEASVEAMVKHYRDEFFEKNEHLASDLAEVQSEGSQKAIDKCVEEFDVAKDDIIGIYEDGEVFCHSYSAERKVLDYVVDELYDDNQNQFKSRDEVLEQFFILNFNGKLLPLGRLIEKTFGKGTLRVLGMMDAGDKPGARRMLNYLKKHRRSMHD